MAIGARLRGILDELIATGYPEQVAERIASGDLPMDTASRMRRAEAMGFDPSDVQYHGTEADITQFRPSAKGKMGPGVYTTPSPSKASVFAGYPSAYATGGNVMPLLLRGDYIKRADAFDLRPEISGREGQRILNETLEGMGYAGSKAGERGSLAPEVVTFDPQNVRSLFAAFDPEYTGSNILGGTAAAALGLTSLMAPEEAEAAMSGKVIRGLFDLSELEQVPDVPQFALDRYDPPRGRPANLDDILTPETAARLEEYAKVGEQAGGRSWYNTDPLRQSFIDELGQQAGAADYNRFMDIVAATSPRSRVDSNIRRASYFRQLDKQGEQFADLTNPDLPQGYGHLAHETQNALLRDLAQGGSFAALNRPKVSSFAENLKGNQAPMTIDTHNFSAVTGDFKTKKSPAKTQYKYLEEFQSEIADKMNMTPAQFQASVWMGAGTGVADSRPFMEVFDDVLERTAKRDDKSKSAVLKDFIQGKAPLFSMAGGTALATGTLLSPEQAMAMQEIEDTAGRVRAQSDTSGAYAPRSETLQDVTMALRGLERRLEGSPASLLFPSGYVQHLEEFNRPYERSTYLGAALGALDFL